MAAVPLELSAMIMNYLYDDNASLGRCGLVCGSFLPSSRFHFSPLSGFSYLTVSQYVRYLEVDADEDADEDDADEEFLWVNHALLDLPSLSAIQGLCLNHVAWDLLELRAKERLFTLSHGLKSLSLNYVSFNTLGEALELIASTSLLECLTIRDIECESEDASITQFTTPPLQQITFKGDIYPMSCSTGSAIGSQSPVFTALPWIVSEQMIYTLSQPIYGYSVRFWNISHSPSMA